LTDEQRGAYFRAISLKPFSNGGAHADCGAVAAVQNASFDPYGGEAYALVGENGAGRSTIVKMLACVHRPDSGTLEIDGTPKQDDEPSAVAADIDKENL
jgi:ABC-type sugar transport system ATPase subunit